MHSLFKVEKKILCKIPVQEIPLDLIAAFCIFNMYYPQGCPIFYNLFDILLMLIIIAFHIYNYYTFSAKYMLLFSLKNMIEPYIY